MRRSFGFRTKTFLAVFAVAAVTLLLAAARTSSSIETQTSARIEGNLVASARLAAELISHRLPEASPDELHREATVLAKDISSRVTFIADDGKVLGDSAVPAMALASLENHGARPEIIEARAKGVGVTRRFSTTTDVDFLYVAVATQHSSIRFVRLAQPLTDIAQQLRAVRHVTLGALGLALASALVLAWLSSALLARRVASIAAVARRYIEGDLTPPGSGYGSDEIGAVAQALDRSVQELGNRMAELTRGRARMEAILAGMVEGVLVVDAQGRVQLANDAARRILNLGHEPLDRSHYLEAIRHPHIVDQVGAALTGQAIPDVEVSLSGNPERWFVARTARVSGGGAVLVLHDITDLRRADQIRRDFVANVSHELRTPLTAIGGYVEALLDGPDDMPEARGFLKVIARHTSRMDRLVKDLLRLARLDAGQEALEMVPCGVASLFTAVLAELAPAIEARHQRVETSIASDATVVNGDQAKLHDALHNLIENAIHYSTDGSAIRLESDIVDDELVLRVIDEGPGIPEADLTRVFERFYRVDKSRSREPGGTGLGLAIVRHLIEAHGGRVRAANRSPRGAVFTISLPRPKTTGV